LNNAFGFTERHLLRK